MHDFIEQTLFHFKGLAFINTLAEWERLCRNVGSALSRCSQGCAAGRMGMEELGCWSHQPDLLALSWVWVWEGMAAPVTPEKIEWELKSV